MNINQRIAELEKELDELKKTETAPVLVSIEGKAHKIVGRSVIYRSSVNYINEKGLLKTGHAKCIPIIEVSER